MLSELDILEILEKIKHTLHEQVLQRNRERDDGKRRKADSLNRLEDHGNKNGFSEKVICEFSEFVTIPYMDISLMKRMILFMNPRASVNSDSVIAFLSALSSLSMDVKKNLLKWMCVSYPYTTKSAKQAYSKLYSTIFFHLDNEELLPYICHLLYLITTRQSITSMRKERLFSLFSHSIHSLQSTRPLYLLMELYSQYDASITLPPPQKGHQGYYQFVHVDDDWSERIAGIQKKNRDYGIDEVSSLSSHFERMSNMSEFRLLTQLSLQTQDKSSQPVELFHWPRGRTQLNISGDIDETVTFVSLDQITSTHEFVYALQGRRIVLLWPDESLAIFAPHLSRFSIHSLLWTEKGNDRIPDLFRNLPEILSFLYFECSNDVEEMKKEILQQLSLLVLYRRQLPRELASFVRRLIEKDDMMNAKVILLCAFLPIGQLQQVQKDIQVRFHKSPRIMQLQIFDSLLEVCVTLRVLIRHSLIPDLLDSVHCVESIIDFCVTDCLLTGDAPMMIYYRYVSYLHMQIRIYGRTKLIGLPRVETLSLLVETGDLVLYDGLCQFLKEVHTVIGDKLCERDEARVIQLEGIVREIGSRFELSSSFVFGNFVQYMIGKENKEDIVGKSLIVDRFIHFMNRYQFKGLDLMLL